MVAARTTGSAPTGQGLADETYGPILAFQRLIDGLRAIGSVVKIAHSLDVQPHRAHLDLWVLMPTENLEDEKQAYRLERAYNQIAGAPPIETQVLFLDRPDTPGLPPHQVIFERSQVLDRADREAHLNQARSNLALARRLLTENAPDPVGPQWAVTLVFYCAVHCIEAHFAGVGISSLDHGDRDALMIDHHMQVPEDVYASYRVLYARSRAARYRMARFDATYVQRVLIDQELATIARWVNL